LTITIRAHLKFQASGEMAAEEGKSKDTDLHFAAEKGDVKEITDLIRKKKLDPNAKGNVCSFSLFLFGSEFISAEGRTCFRALS
jgi:hypothetical protein